MRLKSSSFEEGKPIPRKYTCQGTNISPPLEISDVPKGAKTLALIMDDPDVPKNLRKDGLFVHWVAFNIDPKTNTIGEGISTLGTPGQNTYGENGYKGPCPPDREHRYFFKLYALDTELKLSEGATKEDVEKAMKGHILEEVVLMGTYEKS